jgi:hypothetical protein
MPITSFSNDYTGRQKDINLAHKIDPTSREKQKVSLSFGSVSSFCSGTQKLVQRYMISLLTALGSQSNTPEFGTDLLPTVTNNRYVSLQDLKHTFNFANWKVINEFRTYQNANPDLPADEQLNTATLSSLNVNKGVVHFQITLLTLAGDEIEFLVPLPIVK